MTPPQPSMMPITLIVGADNDIGAALADQTPGSHTTSTNGRAASYQLDPESPPYTIPTGIKYDRLVYTIAARRPTSPLDIFRINVIAAYSFLEWAARNLLAAGAQVVVLSNREGSIADAVGWNMPHWRMSRSAIHMGVSLLYRQHQEFEWLCVDPGLAMRIGDSASAYSGRELTPWDAAHNVLRLADTRPLFGLYETSGQQIFW